MGNLAMGWDTHLTVVEASVLFQEVVVDLGIAGKITCWC